MIAEDVAANLAGSSYFESVDVVKPGFINLKLSKERRGFLSERDESRRKAWRGK